MEDFRRDNFSLFNPANYSKTKYSDKATRLVSNENQQQLPCFIDRGSYESTTNFTSDTPSLINSFALENLYTNSISNESDKIILSSNSKIPNLLYDSKQEESSKKTETTLVSSNNKQVSESSLLQASRLSKRKRIEEVAERLKKRIQSLR